MEEKYKGDDDVVLFPETTTTSGATSTSNNMKNDPPPPYFQTERGREGEFENLPMYSLPLPLGLMTRNSPLQFFNEILGNNELFTFYSTGEQCNSKFKW